MPVAANTSLQSTNRYFGHLPLISIVIDEILGTVTKPQYVFSIRFGIVLPLSLGSFPAAHSARYRGLREVFWKFENKDACRSCSGDPDHCVDRCCRTGQYEAPLAGFGSAICRRNFFDGARYWLSHP